MVDRRVLQTIIAEAGGDPEAMQAVAAVIHNRAVATGKTPLQVVKQRAQFEGYSNPGPSIKKQLNNSALLATARQSYEGISTGAIADPTGGAVMYHADYVSPYWAKSANKNGTVNIGGNIFYKGNGALSAIDSATRPSETVASTSGRGNLPSAPSPIPLDAMNGVPRVSVNADPHQLRTLFGQEMSIPDEQTMQLAAAQAGGTGNLQASGTGRSGTGTGGLSALQSGLLAGGGAAGQPTMASAGADLAGRIGNPSASGSGNSGEGGFGSSSLAPIIQAALAPRPNHGIQVSQVTPAGNTVDANPPLPRSRPSTGSLEASGFGGASILPASANLRPNNITAEGLTIRPVQTVQIDPFTGNPVSSVSRATPAPAPAASPLQMAMEPRRSGGFQTTSSPAGVTGLPAGVVPSSVQRGYETIASAPAPSLIPAQQHPTSSQLAAINNVAPAPIVPMSRPASLSIPTPRPLSSGPSPSQLSAMNNVTGAYQPPITHTAVPNELPMSATDPLAVTAYGADPATPATTAITAATGPMPPMPRPRPDIGPARYVPPTGPAMPAPATYHGPSPTTRPLTSFHTVNPATQIVPHVQSAFAQSGIGHIIQLLSGDPVQGGLLSLIPRPGGSPSNAAPQVPAAQRRVGGESYLQAQGQNTAGLTPGQIANNLMRAIT